ncbi:hypothetical protein ASO20_00195 [Mycoplasma sp. (ex Biomphalaria glabrata)]|uniref:nucleotide exchange factor GrpE n=1 Tax=Mycoplasma sp. (ex Biomphalaria glabrata) TaxID=1749074 RepID=UPI00073A9412|nr:nucleotide exchange factor GrpE [Mycoplasma sp. (ex Biomphalaria glabrata)]ALV23101.1 hypothetical protein ASO20_00195 [Mycoplasma sp. (ex Biomphalaria glabrata)]
MTNENLNNEEIIEKNEDIEIEASPKEAKKFKKQILELETEIDKKDREIKKLKEKANELEISVNSWMSKAKTNERKAKDYDSHVEIMQETKNHLQRQLKSSDENVQKRLEKLVNDFIQPIEWLESSLNAKTDNEEINKWRQGFVMILQKLKEGLENQNVKEINPKRGDEFNHHECEAVEHIETNEVKDGNVYSVASKGYKLNDKVIKYAKVKIAKNI